MHRYPVLAVLRVVDGDTVDTSVVLRQADLNLGMGMRLEQRVTASVRFRVAGIDTPEERGQYAEPAGAEATAFTTAWLHGKHGRLEVRTEKGSDATVGIGDGAFGRWLAHFVDTQTGESLADALRAAGYERVRGRLVYVPREA